MSDHELEILWELVNGVKIEKHGIVETLVIPNQERFRAALYQARRILDDGLALRKAVS